MILRENETSDRVSEYYYFVKGIMMKSEYTYERAIEAAVARNLNIAMMLSPFSKHPVFNLNEEAHSVPTANRYKWYSEGRELNYKRSFMPKFSTKNYIIEKAKTIQILLII